VNLLANGIDTVSSVYINDQLIGKTDNQFVRYVFDVKKVLKSGQNTIRLAFQSAPIYAKQQSDDFKKKYNYIVQPGTVYTSLKFYTLTTLKSIMHRM
jgi:beta-mannosidase